MVPFPSPAAQQKLTTLSALFNLLPDTLPTDSEPSTHQFTLDPEDMEPLPSWPKEQPQVQPQGQPHALPHAPDHIDLLLDRFEYFSLT